MMTEHRIVKTPHAPAAVGTYSQGVQYNGVTYLSGQIGIDPQTGQMQEGFESQLQQILSNIDGLLKACGLSRKHILKTTIFLTDLAQFAVVNEYYEEFFTAPFPARSCVEITRLPKDALVEIEVIARNS